MIPSSYPCLQHQRFLPPSLSLVSTNALKNHRSLSPSSLFAKICKSKPLPSLFHLPLKIPLHRLLHYRCHCKQRWRQHRNLHHRPQHQLHHVLCSHIPTKMYFHWAIAPSRHACFGSHALKVDPYKVGSANDVVCKLQMENAEIGAEMEASKLNALESAKKCVEVSRMEKKRLKAFDL